MREGPGSEARRQLPGEAVPGAGRASGVPARAPLIGPNPTRKTTFECKARRPPGKRELLNDHRPLRRQPTRVRARLPIWLQAPDLPAGRSTDGQRAGGARGQLRASRLRRIGCARLIGFTANRCHGGGRVKRSRGCSASRSQRAALGSPPGAPHAGAPGPAPPRGRPRRRRDAARAPRAPCPRSRRATGVPRRASSPAPAPSTGSSAPPVASAGVTRVEHLCSEAVEPADQLRGGGRVGEVPGGRAGSRAIPAPQWRAGCAEHQAGGHGGGAPPAPLRRGHPPEVAPGLVEPTGRGAAVHDLAPARHHPVGPPRRAAHHHHHHVGVDAEQRERRREHG